MKLNLKNLSDKFKKNISIALGVVLLILFLMEILVVKDSVQGALASREDPVVTQSRLVRVNFTLYDQIIKRLNAAATYAPRPLAVPNPFGVNEKPAEPAGGQ